MKYLVDVKANEMLKIGGIYCLAINIEKKECRSINLWIHKQNNNKIHKIKIKLKEDKKKKNEA